MSIARPQRSTKLGNRKPRGRGLGCSPAEYKARNDKGYYINPKTGLRVYRQSHCDS